MNRPPIDDEVKIARLARALGGKQAILFVILNGELAEGGTATAEILIYDPEADEWQRAGETISVRSVGLNTGQTYDADMKGMAVWYRTTWVFIPLSCEVDDTGI